MPIGWEVRPDPPTLNINQYANYIGNPATILHLWSSNSDSNHRGILFTQYLNRDVRDFLNLDLLVNFKINSQTLPGGGVQGSEYPFRVTVDYVSRSGQETRWFHGYYILPPSGADYADPASQQVAPNQWYPSNSGEGVLALSHLPDPPVFIKSVEFSASGYNFDTDVREVRLVAE